MAPSRPLPSTHDSWNDRAGLVNHTLIGSAGGDTSAAWQRSETTAKAARAARDSFRFFMNVVPFSLGASAFCTSGCPMQALRAMNRAIFDATFGPRYNEGAVSTAKPWSTYAERDTPSMNRTESPTLLALITVLLLAALAGCTPRKSPSNSNNPAISPRQSTTCRAAWCVNSRVPKRCRQDSVRSRGTGWT